MSQEHIPVYGKRTLSCLLLGGILVAATLTTGCGSTAMPCMQYQPQTVTRTVMMRGYGSVQVTEQAMVCTHRASTMEEGIFGT